MALRRGLGRRTLAVAACAGIATAVAASAGEYTGTYYVAIGAHAQYTMTITHTGTGVVFSLSGGGIDLDGTGTVAGVEMTLGADLGDQGMFAATLEFAADAESFIGTWAVTGGDRTEGSIAGTRTAWLTWDVTELGVPRCLVDDVIELEKIAMVSRFRSGEGHDYSDDFESCRSMKHYYFPGAGVERAGIGLYAPVDGTVIGTTDEWEGTTLSKGTAVGIRPRDYPAFDIVIFHILLDRHLEPGDTVVAGEKLGTSAKQQGTVSDLAVGVHTPAGYRLVSAFEAMSQSVFSRYAERRGHVREDFVISREERDADPLSCDKEQFETPGNLENWVDLGEAGLRRTVRKMIRGAGGLQSPPSLF